MISIFEIFKIGIGPSSSHTVGPMKAAKMFVDYIDSIKSIEKIERIFITFYGSLSSTGEGHGTVLATELGLEGYDAESVDPTKIKDIIKEIDDKEEIDLLRKHKIKFSKKSSMNFIDKELPYHPNAMEITAFDKKDNIIYTQKYYSVGGGFVVVHDEINSTDPVKSKSDVKYNYSSFRDLYEIAQNNKTTISNIILKNEKSWRNPKRIDEKIDQIWDVIQESIANGLNRKGEIEGGLHLKRRAPLLYKKLKNIKNNDPLNAVDWVMLWALACAEENASYGRVVTAPTNGAASVIPAVLYYYFKYCKRPSKKGLRNFVLVAGAIGILCKMNASISGAEGGCQAEMGSACAMAAAGLTAALGGTDLQIENAAIIGLTHNLGLTCDPICGLVQVPCIERNAINAIKAISASRLALMEEQSNFITLDQVILTMRQVGDSMPSEYRETAKGGLAVNSRCGRTGFCSTCIKYK